MIIAQHKRKETERDKARKERKERKGKRRRKARKQMACFQKEEEGRNTYKKSPPEVFTSGGLTENGGDLLSHLYAVPSAR